MGQTLTAIRGAQRRDRYDPSTLTRVGPMGATSSTMQDTLRQSQVVYLVSSPYSGSTWLSFVLGGHPRAATLGEHWRRFRGQRDSECRTCEHKGLVQCEVLHGITGVPLQEAYSMPLRRFASQGVDTLIDNSKQLDWLQELLASGACDSLSVRVIHLIRDPRGWICSCIGRNPQYEVANALSDWNKAVLDQQARLEALGLPVLRVLYDAACLDSERILEGLSAFIGIRYAVGSLRYWERAHHAMAGNGAAMNVLPGAKGVTWDRDYYLDRLGKVFYDDRWRRRLDPAQARLVVDDPETARLMRAFGAAFERIDELAAARDAANGESL